MVGARARDERRSSSSSAGALAGLPQPGIIARYFYGPRPPLLAFLALLILVLAVLALSRSVSGRTVLLRIVSRGEIGHPPRGQVRGLAFNATRGAGTAVV